ncbi:AAA ATPase [Lecanora helva]
MTSILGKRARTTESNAETSISSRVKRRARTSTVNDENVAPLATCNDQDGGGREATVLDELDFPRCNKSIPSRIASIQGRKVVAPPRKPPNQNKIFEESLNEKNIVQLPTPQTPRRHDVLSKRVPVTPRHRIGLIGKPSMPSTPRSLSTASKVPSIYQHARQLFTGSADPGPFLGREDEQRALQNFLDDGIASKTGRGLYVSGPPGTGKSALVGEVCRNVQGSAGVKTAYINCMSVKHPRDIYGKLIEEFLDDAEIEDQWGYLQAALVPRKQDPGFIYVLTLDEIDHLLTLDLEILYTLFECSFRKRSRLIVIGIANALDLTDRFLPRLKARNLKPQLLPFLPYTAPQIAFVITAKLNSLVATDATVPADHVPFVQPPAIQLCSKKVASQSGDLRKAFDIIRRTIDLVESEVKQKCHDDFVSHSTTLSPSRTPLGENLNLSSPVRIAPTRVDAFARLTSFTAPRATIAHLSRVSAAALGQGTSQRLQSLNLQQRAALCALISHQKSANGNTQSIFATPSKTCTAPLVRKVFETYCTLCRHENTFQAITCTEFADIISGLETLGLVVEEKSGRCLSGGSGTPSRKKGHGMADGKRVVSCVDENELRNCLQGASREILLGLLDSNASGVVW